MSKVAQEKSFNLAIKIIKLSEEVKKKHGYELASQVLRSGTSIGANLAEAEYAQSQKDLLSKLKIAQKEASETKYWLRLLKAVGYISDRDDIIKEVEIVQKILYSAVKTLRSK